MIWSSTTGGWNIRKGLRQFIREEMNRAGVLRGREEHAAEVAEGIATFWEDSGCPREMPCPYVAGMIARALWGVGERQAAEQVAASCANQEAAASVRDVTRLGLPSLPVWRCLRQRLYREGSWAGAGGEAMWVLDLGRLSGSEQEILPLAWWPALRALLGGMAEFWDASGGRGILGLRGLAGLRAGRARAGGRIHRLEVVAETLSFCRSVLDRLREERGWVETPRLLLLDAALTS